jgi:hypothetical protein
MSDKRLTASDARSMMLEILELCPALGHGALKVDDLISAVLQGVGANLNGLEARIAELGAIDGEVAAGFMAIGAMAEVAADLVGERAELVLAGRAVGRMMRKRYAAKISEDLDRKKGAAS